MSGKKLDFEQSMARLEEITVEQVDRKLSGGPCPGGG